MSNIITIMNDSNYLKRSRAAQVTLAGHLFETTALDQYKDKR